MRWQKEEIDFLKENYPKNLPLQEISKKIGKTIKAIRHKAERIGVHRPRFPSNKPRKRLPKKIIDKRYYEKHKKEIYKKKLERRRKIKKEMVEMLGGKCKICGYNKCSNAFDFHHVGNNKENLMNTLLKGAAKQKILKEVKKCILLCANCHRELHSRGHKSKARLFGSSF